MVANGSGVLARHDLEQGLALLGVGALVHERNRLAVTFMDRPGPFEDCGKSQPIEPGVAVAAFVDFNRSDGVTMAFVGKRGELAVATVIA